MTRNTGGMEVRCTEHPAHREYNIRMETSPNVLWREEISGVLKKLGAAPLNGFVLGVDPHHSSPDPLGFPVTELCGREDGTPLSIQMTALEGVSIRPLVSGGRLVGSAYEDSSAEYIRLTGVLPSDLSASRAQQTLSVLENLDGILRENGMEFSNTIRTWLYLDRLLDWYDTFNAVRTRFFEEKGIFRGLVPASTGIGAGNPQGAAIVADLLAVRSKCGEVGVVAVNSPLQNSATDYHSSFSRAVEVALPTHRTLYVSGTASIDKSGRTVHRESAGAQIDLTMRVVGELLSSRAMGWQDVSRGIAYFKNSADAVLLENYCRETGIGRLPLSFFHADICRRDLLFEIEVDAVKSSQKRGSIKESVGENEPD